MDLNVKASCRRYGDPCRQGGGHAPAIKPRGKAARGARDPPTKLQIRLRRMIGIFMAVVRVNDQFPTFFGVYFQTNASTSKRADSIKRGTLVAHQV